MTVGSNSSLGQSLLPSCGRTPRCWWHAYIRLLETNEYQSIIDRLGSSGPCPHLPPVSTPATDLRRVHTCRRPVACQSSEVRAGGRAAGLSQGSIKPSVVTTSRVRPGLSCPPHHNVQYMEFFRRHFYLDPVRRNSLLLSFLSAFKILCDKQIVYLHPDDRST